MKTKLTLLLCSLALAAMGTFAAIDANTAMAGDDTIVDEANVEEEIVASLEANVAKRLIELQQR